MCAGEGPRLLLFDVVRVFACTIEEVVSLRCSGLLGYGLAVLRRFLVSAMGGGSAVSSWSSVPRCESRDVVVLGSRRLDGMLRDTCC